MNPYELMLIFDPRIGEEKISQIAAKIEDKAKSFGAEIEKTDKIGVRRLASNFRNLKRMNQAYYVMVYFKAETSVPAKITAYLKTTENIVRYSVYKATEKPPLEEIKGAPVVEAAPKPIETAPKPAEAGKNIGQS